MTYPNPPQQPDQQQPGYPAQPQQQQISPAEANLNRQVAQASANGWHVQYRDATQAVMVKQGTKLNHILHLLLTVFTAGIWGFVWIWLAMFKKREKTMTLYAQ